MRAWVFAIAFALVWYGNGAAFVESFVNYPSWHLVGSEHFPVYFQFIGPRVIAFFVAPAVLGTIFTIALIWLRPSGIPAWAVWGAILTQTVVWASTIAIQLPIQFALGESGFSVELIERLITTNFWLRRVPYAISAVLFLWMAVRLIVAPSARRTA
jgi:hypothetical protein